MKKNAISTTIHWLTVAASTLILAGITNAALAIDRQKPPVNAAGLPVVDSTGKHLNYDRKTLQAAMAKTELQKQNQGHAPQAAAVTTAGFVPATATQKPFWQYAVFGSGIGSSNILVGPTPQGGGSPEIIFGNDFNFWQSVRWNSATNNFDQVFVSPVYQPRNGDPFVILARIGLAHVTSVSDWQIVVMLGDGRIYLYDFSTKAQIGYFDAGPFQFYSGLQALCLKDLNGDGLAELIMTTSDFGSNTLYVFSGAGQLLWQVAGAGGGDVVAGQMDNDPALEIATTSGKVVDAATHAVQWTRSGGFGVHLALAPIPGGNYQQLIEAESWGVVYSYDVGLQLPRWSINTPQDIGAIAVADVNGDSTPEVIIGDAQWGTVHVHDLNTQAEMWHADNPEYGVTNIAVANVAGDGVLHLLWGAGAGSSGPDHLYVASTTGSHSIEWQNLDLEGPFLGPAIGDLDGDGQPELVICSTESDAGYGSGRILVFDLATLTLRAISPPVPEDSFSVYGVEDLKLADPDGNGRMKIVIATDYSYDGALEIYRFDSNNTFTRVWANTTHPSGSPFRFVEVADLDNNGTKKIIAGNTVAHSGSPGVFIYAYDYPSGAQSWRSVNLGPGSSSVIGLIVQDLNGDNNKEIAALVPNGDLYTWDGPSRQLRNLRQNTDGKVLSNRATASGIVLGDSMGVGHFFQYGINSYTEMFSRQLAAGCDPSSYMPCINAINVTADNALWTGASNMLDVRMPSGYDTSAWQSPEVGSSFGRYVATDIRNGERHVFSSAQNAVVGFSYTLPQAPALVTAVSRKTHGAAGTFDINLPSSGLGVESRSPGANGSHVLVLTFDATAVSGQASVTAGVGMVQGQPIFNGNQMTINLTGVTNAQRITVKLSNLNSSGDDVSVSMGVLLGDTNGNGSVNATDVSQTKLKSGQAVDATNFRNDVNANGAINASDVSIAKLNSGTALP